MNLLTIVSAVEAAYKAGEEVVTEFNVLKPYVTQLMDAAESAYSDSRGAGASKLSAVMAATKAIASQLGLSWSTGLEAAIAGFIAVAKAAFNAFASVVTAVDTSAGTAAVVANASAVVSNAASAATSVLASTAASPA
jgi:hypothetical protein